MNSSQQIKIIPFDLPKAKTKENPKGLEVITVDGHKCRILDTERKDSKYNVVVAIDFIEKELIVAYSKNGKIKSENISEEHPKDLRLIQPITKRLMTNQELSWWLREHSEEHRECTYFNTSGGIWFTHAYNETDAHKEVKSNIRIRSNGGPWKIPFKEY